MSSDSEDSIPNNDVMPSERTNNQPTEESDVATENVGERRSSTTTNRTAIYQNDKFIMFLIDQLTDLQEQNHALGKRIEKLEKIQLESNEARLRSSNELQKDIKEYKGDIRDLRYSFNEILNLLTGDRLHIVENESVTAIEPIVKEEPSNAILIPAVNSIPPSSNSEPVVDTRPLGPQINISSNISQYRLSRKLRTVTEVATEYYEGLPNCPSVLSLDRLYGTKWRNSPSDRTIFAKRMCLIHRVENLLEYPEKFGFSKKLSRSEAVRVMENLRLGNNSYRKTGCRMTLAQLYEYLSKKEDSIEDYSLTINKKASPWRAMRIRERAFKTTQPTSSLETVQLDATEQNQEE